MSLSYHINVHNKLKLDFHPNMPPLDWKGNIVFTANLERQRHLLERPFYCTRKNKNPAICKNDCFGVWNNV